jgi:hypothetical protein
MPPQTCAAQLQPGLTESVALMGARCAAALSPAHAALLLHRLGGVRHGAGAGAAVPWLQCRVFVGAGVRSGGQAAHIRRTRSRVTPRGHSSTPHVLYQCAAACALSAAGRAAQRRLDHIRRRGPPGQLGRSRRRRWRAAAAGPAAHPATAASAHRCQQGSGRAQHRAAPRARRGPRCPSAARPAAARAPQHGPRAHRRGSCARPPRCAACTASPPPGLRHPLRPHSSLMPYLTRAAPVTGCLLPARRRCRRRLLRAAAAAERARAGADVAAQPLRGRRAARRRGASPGAGRRRGEWRARRRRPGCAGGRQVGARAFLVGVHSLPIRALSPLPCERACAACASSPKRFPWVHEGRLL